MRPPVLNMFISYVLSILGIYYSKGRIGLERGGNKKYDAHFPTDVIW